MHWKFLFVSRLDILVNNTMTFQTLSASTKLTFKKNFICSETLLRTQNFILYYPGQIHPTIEIHMIASIQKLLFIYSGHIRPTIEIHMICYPGASKFLVYLFK